MKQSKKTIAMLAVVAFLIVAAVPMALASSTGATVTATPDSAGTATYTLGSASSLNLNAQFTAASDTSSGSEPAASDSGDSSSADESSAEESSEEESSTEESSAEESSEEESSAEESSAEESSEEESSEEESSEEEEPQVRRMLKASRAEGDEEESSEEESSAEESSEEESSAEESSAEESSTEESSAEESSAEESSAEESSAEESSADESSAEESSSGDDSSSTGGAVTWAISPAVDPSPLGSSTSNTNTFGGSGKEAGLVVGTVYTVTATQGGQTARFSITVQTPGGSQQSSAPAASASNAAPQTPTTPSSGTIPSVAPGTAASQPAASASASASASSSSAPSSSPVNNPVTINPDAVGAPEDLAVMPNPTGEGSILVGPTVSTPDEKTTVKDVLSWVNIPEGGSAKVVLPNGQTASDDAPIGTGMVVQVLDADGNVIEETTVVVKGDVLGTGEMSLTQLVNLAQAFTGAKPLEGVYNLAADLDGNGSINLTDLVMEAKMFKDAGLTMTK